MIENIIVEAVVAGVGGAAAVVAGIGGYYVREIRKNSRFRRFFTGEDIEHEPGELAEIETAFSEIRDELETSREERHHEHEKVWEALSAIHTTVSNLVREVNARGLDVEEGDHPFQYRGGSSASSEEAKPSDD
jgi:hypothetical protein